MTLLHENDNHFNLVVNKNSDLAVQGSLSYRFNIGPIVEENEISEEDNGTGSDGIDELKSAKKELNRCEKGKKHIENEYFKCEKELKIKTEEVEKLKTEIRDLKAIINLSNKLEDEHIDQTDTENKLDTDQAQSSENNKNENPWIKPVNKANRLKKKIPESTSERSFNDNMSGTLPRGLSGVDKEGDFSCYDCAFQGTSKSQLIKHRKLKHERTDASAESSVECKYCGKKFNEKQQFMNHRKSEHPGTVAVCRNNAAGKCDYSAEACWWSHVEQQKKHPEMINCFICNKIFKSRAEMMIHRKKNHPKVVRPCDMFLKKNCRFRDDSCWFLHASESDDKIENEEVDDDVIIEEQKDQSVFQKLSLNLKPPFKNPLKKQKME